MKSEELIYQNYCQKLGGWLSGDFREEKLIIEIIIRDFQF